MLPKTVTCCGGWQWIQSVQSALHGSKHISNFFFFFFRLFELTQSHDLSLPALLHPALPMTHWKVISLGLFGELLVPVFSAQEKQNKKKKKEGHKCTNASGASPI